VDYTNRLRARGMNLEEAVTLGGRTRLRPILMTTLCTILGLIPMAVGLGEGSESNAPHGYCGHRRTFGLHPSYAGFHTHLVHPYLKPL